MNWKHLLWIIPLTFLLGMMFYYVLSAEQNKHFFDITYNCLKELSK